MLRGFAAAAKEEPQLRLLLAGAGAEKEMLRALAKELGVSDRVHFTGWLDDTEALYASLDICLLTSLSETFPYALTDAAKYCVPVIATAVGGVPELVENGVHGLLIAPGRYRRAWHRIFWTLSARSGAARKARHSAP